MNTEQERAAFKAWIGITPCGSAHDLAWEAWQARAALQSQDQEDAERLRYLLSKVCMYQSASYGCKFEILNLPPHFGDLQVRDSEFAATFWRLRARPDPAISGRHRPRPPH